MPGGRQLLSRPVSSEETVELVKIDSPSVPPGVLVAAPAPGGGARGLAYTSGTSNSAALATHAAARIIDVLEDSIVEADDVALPDAQYHPVVTKALLVHEAVWGPAADDFQGALRFDPLRRRNELARMLGYGAPSIERIGTASSSRAVLIGAGSIRGGQRQSFSLPLPPSLAAMTDWRRLTLTLAWISPVNCRSWRHRQARLWMSVPDATFGVRGINAVETDGRRGTVQHLVLEGDRALAFTRGDAASIDVDCRIDAGRVETPIRFGLAVSVELAASTTIDVQAEIRDAIRVVSRARAQVASR